MNTVLFRTILIALVLLFFISAGLYVFLFYTPTPVDEFLQLLSTYDEDELETQWPILVGQARTSAEYLALLRLFYGNIDLDEAFVSTLMRALNRYRHDDTFLAFAVYYSLENPSNAVFNRYLTPVNMQKIYQSYPEIAQRYAISNLSDNIDASLLQDETLYFAQRILSSEFNDNDLFLFWKISDKENFLYSSLLLAMLDGKIDVLGSRSRLLSEEWKNDPSKQGYFLNSFDFDLFSSDSFDSDLLSFDAPAFADIDSLSLKDIKEEEIIGASILYIRNFNFEGAYVLLDSFLEKAEEEGYTVRYDTYLVYLWLQERLGRASREYYQRGYELYGSKFEYIYYAFLARNNMDASFLDITSLLQKQEYRLAQTTNVNNTAQQVSGLLWEELNERPSKQALEFALLFFIQHEFYSDAILLINEYKEKANLNFYEFYLEQVLNNVYLSEDALMSEFLNSTRVSQHKWWQYYNVGLFFLNSSQDDKAVEFFEQAKNLAIFYNTQAAAIVYAQLSKAYASTQNIDLARQNYEIFTSLNPSSPYREELEEYLNDAAVLR